MKIEVCGKGGSGKSTLAALMAQSFARAGFRVLLVDADESNMGLQHALAGSTAPVHLMDFLGGKKGFKEKLNQKMMMDNPAGIFSGRQTIDDLPADCVTSEAGVEFLVIGKIHHFGEGCACPMGILSKKFLASLETRKGEIILVDTEAGVEHFGRGMAGEADIVLGVVDPTAESFRMAEKITEMAQNANAAAYFVLNKVEPNIEEAMLRYLDGESVIGRIPKNNEIFLDSLEGRILSARLPEIDAVCREIGTRHGLMAA